jgi:hypothetical protein
MRWPTAGGNRGQKKTPGVWMSRWFCLEVLCEALLAERKEEDGTMVCDPDCDAVLGRVNFHGVFSAKDLACCSSNHHINMLFVPDIVLSHASVTDPMIGWLGVGAEQPARIAGADEDW